MIELPVRTWPRPASAGSEALLTREWLVANGLGGYASGTVVGVCTRRYHGPLVAALPAPLGRVLMLAHLSEELRLPGGQVVKLSGVEHAAALDVTAAEHVVEFRLEGGLPVWRHAFADGTVVEKRLVLPHQQNTVHLCYRRVAGARAVRLKLRPAVHFRSHDSMVGSVDPGAYSLVARGERYELEGPPPFPPLRMRFSGERTALTLEPQTMPDLLYRVEGARGYLSRGDLWSPGFFRAELGDQPASLVASVEPWSAIESAGYERAESVERERRLRLLEAAPAAAQRGPAAELVLAADQFVIAPASRLQDSARAQATGEQARTVIAGYHWFTDWGRDTMISLEGLTLCTGRRHEARWILGTFAEHVRDGLIPNLFPEGGSEGLYHTADATLWFFHALDRYLEHTGDRALMRRLLPILLDIIEHHARGTRFGIRVDPADGLLTQGAEGYALTWMDAKCDGWVVTPRRGKAVEINALYYNALLLLSAWLRGEGENDAASRMMGDAERLRGAFAQRFWNEATGHLFDVVDGAGGDDPACRPNQVLSMSLRHPVLEPRRWAAVLEAVERELLTPVGLRSLARGHEDYRASYHGDLRTRDAAYHQGTVWSWLIGPYLDACARVRPEDAEGQRAALQGLVAHLDEACMGSVSEVFDAEAPFTARGCVAQAWGVAELLRALLRVGQRDAG
jgi:predicted glycogen debranching enzyme